MVNFRPIFNGLYEKFDAFMDNFKWVKAFFLRGEIRYTPSERREKGERSGYRQDPIISIVHRHTNPVVKGKRSSARNTLVHSWQKERTIHRHITLTAKGKRVPVRYTQIIRWVARPSQGTSRDPHPVGRDPHPLGHQPGHQGEWASVKETSHTQRLQSVH